MGVGGGCPHSAYPARHGGRGGVRTPLTRPRSGPGKLGAKDFVGECSNCTSLTRPRAEPGKCCATPGYGGWGGRGGVCPSRVSLPPLPWRRLPGGVGTPRGSWGGQPANPPVFWTLKLICEPPGGASEVAAARLESGQRGAGGAPQPPLPTLFPPHGCLHLAYPARRGAG